MKAVFRKAANQVFALTLVALCAGFTAAAAQSSRDLRVVSARAGGVNYVIGDVKLRRKDATRWQAFGGDSAIVGQTVRLGDAYATVVGVMPDGFTFPVAHDAWTPFRPAATNDRSREVPRTPSR